MTANFHFLILAGWLDRVFIRISALVDRFSHIGHFDSSSFVPLHAVDIRTNQSGQRNAGTFREPKATRILKTLNETDGLTRNELVERSGLTYEQVRRQTHKLNISGVIESRFVDREQRYFIKRVKVNRSTAMFFSTVRCNAIVLLRVEAIRQG